MNRTAWLQDRRMQKFRDVLSRWERKELTAARGSKARPNAKIVDIPVTLRRFTILLPISGLTTKYFLTEKSCRRNWETETRRR